ncbi:hypothetical protein C5167_034707 [Papaver somniferum]|uniref:Peptidase S8/S53 domain-containing protein n=1 Tax=Papaver somniferum TaxID=3469 RepID=A0A4Y7KF80_PAPSO|nr:hypothetical protein C5167_034707 [Papaver somniferum]
MAASITHTCFALHDDRKVYMGSLPSETQYHSILQEILEENRNGGYSVCISKRETSTSNHEIMETAKRVHTVESDTIVGVIDSGIWPESASFSDEGFGPPPKKWKGVCAGGQNFTCNKVYAKEVGDSFPSARDIKGHGTHTASIAAGNMIKDASFYDVSKGTARGAVPSARIAVYKVCRSRLEDECYSHDILAGFDDAIADGVDILSLSMRSWPPTVFYEDPYAIGAFHAIEKDILTSQGAGNTGSSQTVLSTAPWMFTVGATITDRHLVTKVVLGNGKTLVGNGVNAFNLNGTKFPLYMVTMFQTVNVQTHQFDAVVNNV